MLRSPSGRHSWNRRMDESYSMRDVAGVLALLMADWCKPGYCSFLSPGMALFLRAIEPRVQRHRYFALERQPALKPHSDIASRRRARTLTMIRRSRARRRIQHTEYAVPQDLLRAELRSTDHLYAIP